MSKSLWIVRASLPVDDAILFDAIPVGAASDISGLCCPSRFTAYSSVRIYVLSKVVFPEPGPPVITDVVLRIAENTALR